MVRQLIDCQHVFDVSGLDSWMNQQAQNPAIQLPHCPNCRTPIRQTYRYTFPPRTKVKTAPPHYVRAGMEMW